MRSFAVALLITLPWLNPFSPGPTAAVLPLLKESKTILFGPVTGASALRDNVNPHVFHVRAGYANEATRILSQLKQIGVTRVAFFYQDDGLGKALLAEVRKSSAAEHLPLAVEVRWIRLRPISRPLRPPRRRPIPRPSSSAPRD
jgi:ABC-type branched-subunit amino acid transport system substrate-binding protein